MFFTETPLRGAYIIEIDPRADARGFFARTVSDDQFSAYGLNSAFVEQSVSWNPLKGTLRGLHFQAPPHTEDKLLRVTMGAIFDVIVDLRATSSTRGRWFGMELTAEKRHQLFVPKGFAHGFQTTAPHTEVLYQMTTRYHPEAPRGVRWNDQDLQISWPLVEGLSGTELISTRDETWPDLSAIQWL